MLATSALRFASAQRSNVRCASTLQGVLGGFLGEHPGQLPATMEFPGVPAQTGAMPPATGAQVSTLANGVRVVTQDTHSALSHVAVFVDAGSRSETIETEGAAHVLNRLAFKSTTSRSHLRVVRDLEDAGANFSSEFCRDGLCYKASALRTSIGNVLPVVADTIINPLFAEWEVQAWQSIMSSYDYSHDAGTSLSELTYAAAFLEDSGLGHSKFCPSYHAGAFTAADLKAITAEKFVGGNVVVSATGVDHAEFAAQVGDAFTFQAGSSPAAASPYAGGEARVRGAPTGAAYYSISFEAPSASASVKDLAALYVLRNIIGATPNKAHDVGHSASRLALLEGAGVAHAHVATHSDTGLFSVFVGTDAANAGSSFEKVAATIKKTLSGDVSAAELQRAKSQTKRAYLDNASVDAKLYLDLGHTLVTRGDVFDVAEATAAVDSVTADDLQRVGASMLSKQPTFAAMGATSQIPRFDAAAKLFN